MARGALRHARRLVHMDLSCGGFPASCRLRYGAVLHLRAVARARSFRRLACLRTQLKCLLSSLMDALIKWNFGLDGKSCKRGSLPSICSRCRRPFCDAKGTLARLQRTFKKRLAYGAVSQKHTAIFTARLSPAESRLLTGPTAPALRKNCVFCLCMECCSTSTRPPHGLSLLRAAAAMASVVQSRCVFDVLALRSLSISYIFVGAACSRERKVMGTCAYGENALRACCKPFALDAVQEMLCASGTELLFMLYEDMCLSITYAIVN
mmetsp:Transcript_39091/g.82030  ORF Transcript_39091/g.82030 Transcript_39091/m.82030 type:complete len:265 (+) Transcript_39091:445-1239(+)